jgi:thiol-disulfide isomerase/thioredoxin
MAGFWTLLGAVAVALVLGGVFRWRTGRARKPAGASRVGRGVVELPEELRERVAAGGERVTLLQLSSTFCQPCRHTRVLLDDFAKRTDGVRHVEVDLTEHPEWSEPLRVHTTPTTLALDGDGRELFRVGGVPKRSALGAALEEHLG